MTALAGARARARPVAGWRQALPLLAGLWALVLLLFARDVRDMVSIWWNSSTFNHILFVPAIVGWLVWQRAGLLARMVPRDWAGGLAVVAAGAAGWLLGAVAGAALARHLGIVLMLAGGVIALLGPVVSRALAFPLGYMLALVPAGDGLVPPLQTLTARMCMILLGISGIPARLDGVFITTASGWFEVAEACSGAKFLIAMIAFGALAANQCFRSPWRRAGFMAAAVAVPVLANGVRAFGTILVAHFRGTDVAGGFDHVVYGWIFFAVVIAILLAGSWRFFDRPVDDVPFDPRLVALAQAPDHAGRRLAIAGAGAAIVALAAGWAAVALAAGRPLPGGAIRMPAPAGWTRIAPTAGVAWRPAFPGADAQALVRYRDAGGAQVDLAIAAFAEQREGHEMVGFGIGAVGANSRWAWASDAPPPAGGRAIRIVGPGETVRDVLVFYRIGGVTTGSANRVKLATIATRLTGAPRGAVAVLLSAQAPAGGSARLVLDRFLAAIGLVDMLADGALADGGAR